MTVDRIRMDNLLRLSQAALLIDGLTPGYGMTDQEIRKLVSRVKVAMDKTSGAKRVTKTTKVRK